MAMIGAGVFAAATAVGGGMAIMSGGEKAVDTSGGEKVENVEKEVSYESMDDGELRHAFVVSIVESYQQKNPAKYEKYKPLLEYYNEDHFKRVAEEINSAKRAGWSAQQTYDYAKGIRPKMPEATKYSQAAEDFHEGLVHDSLIATMDGSRDFMIKRIYENKAAQETVSGK